MITQIRTAVFLLLTGVTIYSSAGLAANPVPETPAACEKTGDPARDSMLEEITKLDDLYAQMMWKARRSWEITYNARWDAEQKMNDSFSSAMETEGEVNSPRFEFDAKRYWEASQLASKTVLKTIATIRIKMADHYNICPSWAYQNCHAAATEKIERSLSRLEILTKQISHFLEETQKIMLATLQESPSDHVPFANRSFEYFEPWHKNWEPELLSQLRSLDQTAVYDLTEANCCQFCTSENIEASKNHQKNPLGQKHVPMPGVGGDILPMPTLGPALDELQKNVRMKPTDASQENPLEDSESIGDKKTKPNRGSSL